MPELPEVETARSLIAGQALHRRIVGVDDADTFVCRPHTPGQLRDALTGRTLTSAQRRGKTMWCETSALDGSAEPGPELRPWIAPRRSRTPSVAGPGRPVAVIGSRQPCI